jgi:hypothetical protein
MTAEKAECIDLVSNSCNTPGFVSKLPSDYGSHYHYQKERVAVTSQPGPILISFDENPCLQNDEMFVSLSGRSRFLLVLSMMLPLSVAFTGLSNHILSPISLQVSSTMFSQSKDAVHTKNEAVIRKSLIDKILSREVSERRSPSESNILSNLMEMTREIYSTDFLPSTSWIIEKSNARYFASVYGMKIINLLSTGTDKHESHVLKKQHKLDLPPLAQNIWNRVKLFDRSTKTSESDIQPEFSNPIFNRVTDSTSANYKTLGSSVQGHFPLIQRLMSMNAEQVKNPSYGLHEPYPSLGHRDDDHLINSGMVNLFDTETSKSISGTECTPWIDENSVETFIPSLLRTLAAFTSGKHSATPANPTPK